MEHVDCPADVEPLPKPSRPPRVRVDAEPVRLVSRPEIEDWIFRYRRRGRDFWKRRSVRPSELERAVGRSLHAISLLVHGPMVPATENREVRECRRPAVRPVAKVVALTESHAAAGEAAALVPVLESAPQRRGNRPRARADLRDAALRIVPHYDAAGVAREAAGRLRGNVFAFLEH